MDYQIEIKFKNLLNKLGEKFNGPMDMESVLFLIGVQELGNGYQKFSKRQKLELIHVATCTILIPYGIYEKIGRDEDNWPHFKLVKELPALEEAEQTHLIKEAIMAYFEDMDNKPTEIEVRESLKESQ
ncbi:MAG: hypothetical protein WC994_06690 [Brumimicrobium sp.]